MHKSISILGATGSIGQSTLRVVRHLKGEVKVEALAAHSQIDLLEAQAREFSPSLIAVYDKEKALLLQKRLPGMRVVAGMEGLKEVATLSSADLLISAMSGSAGLLPTLAAIDAGKNVALANKEVLVMAGELVMQRVKEKGVTLFPIDSEHSALFQCLEGREPKEIRRLILTASGGPFLHTSKEALENIELSQALNHPSWKMGPKVTVDSSTLMNKGLEVIEAAHLFGFSPKQIEVVIHPQSVIHSMVECIDGSMLAQMSEPSMIIPIQYALTYPERREGLLAPFDFQRFSRLDFLPPDLEKFRCLDLAFEALERGGNAPCYLNAANEVLVARFLRREIPWAAISQKLEKLFYQFSCDRGLDLEIILETDTLAREQAFKD